MITSNWKKVKLGDVLELQNGYAFKSSEFTNSGIPVIKIKNMSSGSVFFDTYWQGDIEKLHKYILNKGDIIVSMTGSHLSQRASAVGKVTKYNSEVKGLLNQRVGKFIPNSDVVDKSFIYYLLTRSETQEYWGERAGGAANQANISPDIIKSMEVYLPDLDYQKSIGDIIINYDLIIENNECRIEILEEMVKRIYHEWFVNYKFPGNEATGMVDSGTTYGVIPDGWEVKELKDFATLVFGQSPSSQYYNEERDGNPFHQGVKDFGKLFPIERVYSTSGLRLANKYDLLFSVRAPVGKLNISLSKMIIGRGLVSISGGINTHWFLISAFFNRFTEKDMLGNGAIYKSVNRKEIENLKFIYPKNECLTLFNEIAKRYYQEIETLFLQNRKLVLIRDLLISNLITGKRELNDTTR